MFTVNYATASVCALYGAYVYRVLRRAEYHDLKWLWRRTKREQTNPNSTGQSQTHPAQDKMDRIEFVSDADLYEGVRRIYSDEASIKLVTSGEPDEAIGSIHLPSGWPPKGSQN